MTKRQTPRFPPEVAPEPKMRIIRAGQPGEPPEHQARVVVEEVRGAGRRLHLELVLVGLLFLELFAFLVECLVVKLDFVVVAILVLRDHEIGYISLRSWRRSSRRRVAGC